MQVSSIVKGALVGGLMALVLAIALAVLQYRDTSALMLLSVTFWIAAVLVFLAAGLVAGRSSRSLHWLHGALAAVTLNLVGNVVAETFGHSDNHLWLDLTLALVVGMVGGVWGANLMP